MSNNNSKEKELQVLSDILPSSIIENRFYTFEAGDFKTKEDIKELMMLLLKEPECSFYYFSEKGKGVIDDLLFNAKERGDILMNETEFFYYRHPNFERDFVKIEVRDGKFQWAWQKEIVEKGPMFMRIKLKLSQRKRRELETSQKIATEKNFRKQKLIQSNNKREPKVNDTDLLPKNLWQGFLYILWPLKSYWKKAFLLVAIFFVVCFSIWATLPEKNKIEILNYLWNDKFTTRAPELVKPANGQTFHHFPRTTIFEWKHLPGAVRYIVEVEFQDIKRGTWHPLPWNRNRQAVEVTTVTINFVGAQPGRWRIIAINESGESSKASEWWEFFYTQ